MIIGAHSIIYSTDQEADRAFLRDVLQLPNVDVGGGWLIFGLPPSEVAIHGGEQSSHELYLMCEDVEAFSSEMASQGVACGPVQNEGWGLLTQLTLPGGGQLGVYQPRHARPEPVSFGKVAQKPRSAKKKAAKKSAKKSAKKAVKPKPRTQTKAKAKPKKR